MREKRDNEGYYCSVSKVLLNAGETLEIEGLKSDSAPTTMLAPTEISINTNGEVAMECSQFEELISDYLDCGLARPVRKDFCEHLLACRTCHEVFNEVREAIDACHQLRESQVREVALMAQVEQRIIDATNPGEMLSCRMLDALISDYFEGIIESSYERIFNEHFAICEGCRRLVEGVRESLEEQKSVEVPAELYGRILAATVGARR